MKRNKNHLSLFCWNIGNPSIERAERQAKWLINIDSDIFVLTETKKAWCGSSRAFLQFPPRHAQNKNHLKVVLFCDVPKVGIEPTRDCSHSILSATRLPDSATSARLHF